MLLDSYVAWLGEGVGGREVWHGRLRTIHTWRYSSRPLLIRVIVLFLGCFGSVKFSDYFFYEEPLMVAYASINEYHEELFGLARVCINMD